MIIPESYTIVFNNNNKVEIIEKQSFKKEVHSYVQLHYKHFSFDGKYAAIDWVTENIKIKCLDTTSKYYEEIIKLKKQIKKSRKVFNSGFI